MIKINFITVILTLSFWISSCEKNSSRKLGALNVIHALVDEPPVYVYFTATPSNYYLNQSPVPYGAAAEYGTPFDGTPLTIVSSGDTSQALFQSTLTMKSGGIYSLYLAGQASKKDTLLLEDVIPAFSDSSAGVRFINLSQGSAPMSVNIQGNDPMHTEFDNIGYKQISPFRAYPAKGGVSGYTFEIRDQATGNLLITYSWNFELFRNYTIVIGGLEDGAGAGAINAFAINNF